MGVSYREQLRLRQKREKKESTSVSRAIARSASKARAKVRAQYSRVALAADYKSFTKKKEAPVQMRLF